MPCRFPLRVLDHQPCPTVCPCPILAPYNVAACKLFTHQGGPGPEAEALPPARPQGGPPSPPPHFNLPYFLTFVVGGVGRMLVR